MEKKKLNFRSIFNFYGKIMFPLLQSRKKAVVWSQACVFPPPSSTNTVNDDGIFDVC